MTHLAHTAFDQLQACEIVTSEDSRYDLMRRIFNGYIDRKPHAILYPETDSALLAAVRLLLRQEAPFSIRAGGHNVAGSSLIDGGYVVDTSRLAGIRIDRRHATASVQPGALWRDLDSMCAKFGLCVPGGIISDTGVAGLTLGGGIGWLNGLYGLTCDSLVAADVLLPSGEVVTAAEDGSSSDLLWALRGGGGNFGLVTRFEFRLHPLPAIFAGSVVCRHTGLRDVMHRYVDACDCAPDELTISFVASTGPNEPRVSVDLCFAGDPEEGLRQTSGLLPTKAGALLLDTRRRFSYVNWQRQFDDDLRRGRRSYWRAFYVDRLTDPGFLAVVEKYLTSAPSRHSMLTVDHIHGVAHSYSSVTSAYGDRVHRYLFLINTNWEGEDNDEANLAWCNTLYRELQVFAVSSTYVNYLSQEGDQRIQAAFGANLPRLRELKKRFDPENRFRSNQNIRPV